MMSRNLEQLRALRTPDGHPYHIIELPLPEQKLLDERVLAASYANWYVGNGVVVPQYDDPRDAEAQGAQLVLLPELFEYPYWPQMQREELFALAHPDDGHPLLERFQALAAELRVVLPVSFFERAGPTYFTSLMMIDADGTPLGVYHSWRTASGAKRRSAPRGRRASTAAPSSPTRPAQSSAKPAGARRSWCSQSFTSAPRSASGPASASSAIAAPSSTSRCLTWPTRANSPMNYGLAAIHSQWRYRGVPQPSSFPKSTPKFAAATVMLYRF